MSFSNKQAGFTLIELVIVIVILGILAIIIIQRLAELNSDVEAAICKANQFEMEVIALKVYSQNALVGTPAFPESLMVIKSKLKAGIDLKCPSGGKYSYNSFYGSVTCNHTDHNRLSK
jgi:prepilin-type N-terminal cleavage/methylation domain-containing protein